MKVKEQVDEWVKGNPIHNDERDECCPDFSCCNGGVMATRDVRERFSKAYHENDEETQMQMLGMFLGGAFERENVHIVTGDKPASDYEVN